MVTRRKTAPAEWVAEDSMTLSNGMEVVKWTRGDESRLVPVGMHPDDQPLSETPRMALVPPDGDDEDNEETPLDRVTTLLTAVNGDEKAYIAVYRIVKGNREWCRRYQPDEFEDGTFDMIRDAFGPGEYELRLYATDPRTNKFVVRKAPRVMLASGPESLVRASPAIPDGLNQVLSTIAAGQQQMLQALVDMKQAPQKDPMEEMTKMLSMMTMMREAMGLNQPQAQSRSSIGEIVEAIKELRGAAAEVLPEKEEPADLMGMLPKVLDLVSQGQQAQQQAPMQPMYQGDPGAVLSPVTLPPAFAAQAAQAAQAAHAPTDHQTDNDDMNPVRMLKLRAYLKTLIDHAERKTPTPEVARWVYEKLPDDLIDIMELPSWFEMLSMAAPDVKPHQEYLTTVRDEALRLFNDETGGD